MIDIFKEGVKPNTEAKSDLVVFPDGKAYYLPKYAKRAKMRPTFEGGDIKIETSHQDADLARVVESFLCAIDISLDDTSAHMTIADDFGYTPMYVLFLGMVRYMLQSGYEMSDEQVSDLLTLDSKQYGALFHSVVRHLLGVK